MLKTLILLLCGNSTNLVASFDKWQLERRCQFEKLAAPEKATEVALGVGYSEYHDKLDWYLEGNGVERAGKLRDLLSALEKRENRPRNWDLLENLIRTLKSTRKVPISWEEFDVMHEIAKSDEDWKRILDVLFYSGRYLARLEGKEIQRKAASANVARFIELLSRLDGLKPSKQGNDYIFESLLDRVITYASEPEKDAIAHAIAARIKTHGPKEALRIWNAVNGAKHVEPGKTDQFIAENPIVSAALAIPSKHVLDSMTTEVSGLIVLEIEKRRREITDAMLFESLNKVYKMDIWCEGLGNWISAIIKDPLYPNRFRDREDFFEVSKRRFKSIFGFGSKKLYNETLRRLQSGELQFKDLAYQFKINLLMNPEYRSDELDGAMNPEYRSDELDGASAELIAAMLAADKIPKNKQMKMIGLMIDLQEGEEAAPALRKLAFGDRMHLLRNHGRSWDVAFWEPKTLANFGISAQDATELLLIKLAREDSAQAAEMLAEVQEAFSPSEAPPQTRAALAFYPNGNIASQINGDAAATKARILAAVDRGDLILNRQNAERLLSFTHRADLARQLIRALHRNHNGENSPTDGPTVIAKHVGLDPKNLLSSQFSQHQRLAEDFAQVTLDIQERLSSPLFLGLKLDPSLFQSRNFEQLNRTLDSLRAHVLFKTSISNDTNLPDKLVAGFLGQMKKRETTLGPEQIKALDDKITEATNRSYRNMSDLMQVDLKENDFKSLREAYGDFVPIQVLIGRFAAKPHWAEELPVLGKVFRHMLDNDFLAYKYRGKGGEERLARAQMQPLPEGPRRDAWVKEHAEVGVWRKDAAAASAEIRVKPIQDNVRRLIHHVGTPASVDRETQRAIVELVASARQSMAKSLDDLRRATGQLNPESADQVIFAALTKQIEETTDLRQAHQVARRLVELFDRRVPFTINLSSEARKNVEDLSKGARSLHELDGEAVVITTTFSDPRMLLKIGSLASDQSCQNYRTGSQIQTLLGYVIDANVKGIYSTVLKPHEFKSRNDYEVVRNAIDSGVSVKAEVDGRDLSVKFSWIDPDGAHREYQSLAQSRGFRRHVMKLGNTVKNPDRAGIFLEPAYRSYTPAEAVIQNQVNTLTQRIAREAGSQLGEMIQTVPSRNPGNVYTDLGVEIVPMKNTDPRDKTNDYGD